jgi:hypothetical protein
MGCYKVQNEKCKVDPVGDSAESKVVVKSY